jgi:hypothetical protein
MKPIEPKLVVTGVLFLLTLVSGVWLTHSGRPLNTAIITIHKLIALATVILTGATVYHWRTGVMVSWFAIGGIVITALLFIALFVSGALLSLGKPMPGAVIAMHKVLPLLSAASTAATLYLFVSGKVPA